MAGEESVVFESTACLQYLAEFYDKTGDWAGRTRAEKATVITWTAYQTAGLGWALWCSISKASFELMGPIQTDGQVLAIFPQRLPDAG